MSDASVSPEAPVRQDPHGAPVVLSEAVEVLESWTVADDEEADLRRRYLAELASHGTAALFKGARPVHLTASLVVLDDSGTQVLLTFHRKAHTWLQLGGHVETVDASLAQAALREGREESGHALAAAPVPVELATHLLGGGFTACREHLDARFAVAVPRQEPVVSQESLDVAWWPVAALPEPTGPDVARLVARAVAALAT